MNPRKSLVQSLSSPDALRRPASTTEVPGRGVEGEAGGVGAGEPGPEGPVALLAFHGMGQQVRYGTIEETVGILKAAAARRRCRVALKDRKQLPMDDRFVGCAELVVESDSRRVEVHVFESYWAPLAEGRISTWETFAFLVNAAKESALNGRQFTRYLFSSESPPQGEDKLVPPTAILGLILTALTMGALWVFDFVMLAIAVSGVMVASEPRWLKPLLPALVADYAGAITVVVVAVALFIVVPLVLKSLRNRPSAKWILRAYSHVGNVALKLTAAMLCLIAIDVAFVCIAAAAPDLGRWMRASVASWMLGPWMQPFLAWSHWVQGIAKSRGFLLGLGAAFFAGSSLVRSFVRQYVGDVAIYVSGHKANRFYETRQAIQKTGYELARFIYDRKVPGRSEGLYQQIVFMGHSLGSVIAYDTLNRILLEDSAGVAARDARSRTTGLITYGSPLDKIAFVFRTQRRKDGSLREAMVGSLQPLIHDLGARAHPWVNVYSAFDWIGGDLDFYDHDPKSQGPFPKYPVANVRDDFALTPVAAHGEHAQGPRLQGVVLDSVLGRLEENEEVVKALAIAASKRPRV